MENDFICLDCGSTECGEEMQVGVRYSGDDPWSYVGARDACRACGVVLPRALARRWNGQTLDEAKAIWSEKYRSTSPRWTGCQPPHRP